MAVVLKAVALVVFLCSVLQLGQALQCYECFDEDINGGCADLSNATLTNCDDSDFYNNDDHACIQLVYKVKDNVQVYRACDLKNIGSRTACEYYDFLWSDGDLSTCNSCTKDGCNKDVLQ